jgi:hypothetical protein
MTTLRIGKDYSDLDYGDKHDAQARDLLTDADREDIDKRVREDNKYGDKSKHDSLVLWGIRTAGREVGEFIHYNEDVKWLLQGLFDATDEQMQFDASAKIPGTHGQGPWGRGSKYQTLTRQDVEARVAVHIAEQRDEIKGAREDIADGSAKPDGWCGTIEQCDRKDAELAETLWFAQRWLEFATPYRLWRLTQDIEEALTDAIRESLLEMVTGENTGTTVREAAEREYREFSTKWMKEAQAEWDAR